MQHAIQSLNNIMDTGSAVTRICKTHEHGSGNFILPCSVANPGGGGARGPGPPPLEMLKV